MRKPDGGAAFPRQLPKGKWPPDEALEIILNHQGMTLRDYAVIQFGAGLLAGSFGIGDGRAAVHGDEVIEAATMLADTMLLERDR